MKYVLTTAVRGKTTAVLKSPPGLYKALVETASRAIGCIGKFMYDFGWDIEEGLPNVKPFRELRIKMASCFNMDDLRVLTLDLGLDWDEIVGNTKSLKIAELINLVYRKERLSELLTFLKEERPNIDWPSIVRYVTEPGAIIHMKFEYSVEGMVDGERAVTDWTGKVESSIPTEGQYYDDGLAFAEALGSTVNHFYTFEVEKKGGFTIEKVSVTISNMDYRIDFLE